MPALPEDVRAYVLGNSPREQERLRLQASIVSGWTEQYLRAAGLDRGMRVLDLGCGLGDVSLLAAEIVGPSGNVTGVDRDKVVIEKAQQRADHQGHGAPVEFIHADLLDYHAPARFDAVVGRYVLLYQRDPVNALRHAAEQVRPGGILCFHEMAFGSANRCYPENTLFETMIILIGEVFRRVGSDPDMGLKLAKTFQSAGFGRPILKADVPLGGEAGSYLYTWITETVRTLLPRLEQFGLASSKELDIDTLADRIEQQSIELQSQLIGPIQFGAWTRKT